MTSRQVNRNITGFLLDSVQATGLTDGVKGLLLNFDGFGCRGWNMVAFWCNIQVLEKLWYCTKGTRTAEGITDELILNKHGVVMAHHLARCSTAGQARVITENMGLGEREFNKRGGK